MIQRCRNPNDKGYRNYGAKGVKVCERWASSFEAFSADMGPRPDGLTLDRIDSSGDYCPENCRWADRFQQNNNRSWCIPVVVNGESMTLKQAWRKHAVEGLTYRAFHKRVTKGMPLEEALHTPPRIWPSRHPANQVTETA